MTLAYRATPAVTQSSGAVTSFAVTKQAGTAAGDWIFMYLMGTNSGTIACTGFTVTSPDSDNIGCLIYKQATGAEGSSFTITGIPSSTAVTVGIATVSGASSTAVIGVCSTAGASNTSFTAASITMPAGGGWVIWFGGEQLGFTGNSFSITPPSGFTSRATNGTQTNNACLMVCDNEAATSGATGGKTGTCATAAFWSGVMVGVAPSPVMSGAAALTGSGSLGGAWEFEETAPLSGSGSMGSAGIIALEQVMALSGSGTMAAIATGGNVAASQALSGSGSMGAASRVDLFAAGLSGSGSLSTVGGAGYLFTAGLSGVGLFSASNPYAYLEGEGSLGISGETLGFVVGLSGSGTLSIPQTIGGLVSGVGGAAVPQALPGSSQVAVAPPGSSNWQWLGTLGQVTALSYGYVCPGGCDGMSLTLMVPAAYRTQLFNPGWKVKITRGGHQVWDGILDEPAPSAAGWTLTAVGTGNLGANYLAIYGDTWPTGQPDESVNGAISRGLPWVNPGIGTPSGMWLGQEVDSGAQTVTALLNLVCTRGGLTWYVNSQPGGLYAGDDLSVFPLPTVPNRLLVCTTPVARTLGGDINTIFIRYQTAADNDTTGAAAAFAVTSVQNAADVLAHQVTETYIDLSSAGTMTQAAAQGVGQLVLQIYQRASFSGPFTAAYGQLLTTAGVPIDPACDQAGSMMQLILTDFGYGGESLPGPVSFLVGAYSYDDFSQLATITPYVSLDESLSGMLSAWTTVNTPITVAS
jgi:hypothetical protein